MTKTKTEKKKIIKREQAIKTIAAGEELASLRGLNEETVDFIYAFSAMNYQRGNYDDAVRGFRFLCRHKHREPDMWLALARAQFAKRDYLAALKAYLMVATIRPSAALCLEIARAFLAAAMPEQAKTFIHAAERAILPSDSEQLRGDIGQFQKEMDAKTS